MVLESGVEKWENLPQINLKRDRKVEERKREMEEWRDGGMEEWHLWQMSCVYNPVSFSHK